MKRFLRDLLGFALIQASVLFGLWWSYQPDKAEYWASSIDKHAWMERDDSPRLILVGGSNVAFGFDSQKLDQRLGIRPVNMSLTAGLGMRFMLKEVQPYLRPGDIVVVSPEYEQFGTYGGKNIGHILLRVLEYHPRGMELFSVDWLPPLLDDGLMQYTRMMVQTLIFDTPLQKDPQSPYRRDAFNKYGDVVRRWKLQDKDVSGDIMFSTNTPTTNQIANLTDCLNRFFIDCLDKQVQVYYSYPAIPQPQFRRYTQAIGRIERYLESCLLIPRVNRPEDVCFPVDHFYDTIYHLNRTGVDKRTAMLAERLSRDGK